MAGPDQPVAAPSTSRLVEPAVDLGLRAFMLQVYNYMGLSLGITALVAYGTFLLTATTDLSAAALVDGKPAALGGGLYLNARGAAFYSSWWFVAALVSPLVGMILLYLGLWLSRSVALALALFIAISVSFGLGLSTTLLVYTEGSIAKVFLITATMFGALSLYGYTTTRDLTGIGSFLAMGLMGLVLASLINLAFRSPLLDYGLSILGVVIFTGLTAWDTQKIKESYAADDPPFERTRKAIMGALELYLDFLNLMLHLLKLFGRLRGST